VVGAAVWIPPQDVVITRLPPDAAVLVADQCLRFGQPVTGASGPEDSGLELAEELARCTGAAVRVRVRQRICELLKVNDLPLVAGAMRCATPADLPLVADWYSQFTREAGLAHAAKPQEWASNAVASGSAFLWEDTSAVRSLACLPRETPNGRAIGPVYTPPAARRQGYATSLVSELARSVLASGKRFVVLFTDAANPTSNHIYETIGFHLVCQYDAYIVVAGV
jgi:predicted GNAT family acetyltransferase